MKTIFQYMQNFNTNISEFFFSMLANFLSKCFSNIIFFSIQRFFSKENYNEIVLNESSILLFLNVSIWEPCFCLYKYPLN
jgi:hypothetical protein